MTKNSWPNPTRRDWRILVISFALAAALAFLEGCGSVLQTTTDVILQAKGNLVTVIGGPVGSRATIAAAKESTPAGPGQGEGTPV